MNFRKWVWELWMDNCDEKLIYHETPATMKQYWTTYKWWLRREYRYQHQKAKND